MAIRLTIGPLKKKNALGWSRYRDTNPVPTNPLSDDITTAPSYIYGLLIFAHALWHNPATLCHEMQCRFFTYLKKSVAAAIFMLRYR